jgi:hypothetical protein
LDRQIAIVIGALLDKNQTDHISWAKRVLADAESERLAWSAAETSIRASGRDGEQPSVETAEPSVENTERLQSALEPRGPKEPPFFSTLGTVTQSPFRDANGPQRSMPVTTDDAWQ